MLLAQGSLRVRYDTDIARVFWTYGTERDIWFLGGIIKKDKELPLKDLKNARKLLKLFKERRRKYEKR